MHAQTTGTRQADRAPSPTLRHMDDDDAVRACYPVMAELRPHLENEADLIARIGRMRPDYRLLAVLEHEEVIALAGYRFQENLVYGRFLYVDDLVTTSNAQGRQLGAALLDALTDIATREDCARLVLDTALSNALAQRFYFRQGLLTGAMRFSKTL